MLENLQSLFKQLLPSDDAQNEVTPALAVAVLFSEVIRADYAEDPREIKLLNQLLRSRFVLNETEAEALIQQAMSAVEQAVDHFHYVSLLNDQLSYAERVELIESMWQLAYADKTLEALEEHRVRRIADLLYVSHSDFIRTKLKVKPYQP